MNTYNARFLYWVVLCGSTYFMARTSTGLQAILYPLFTILTFQYIKTLTVDGSRCMVLSRFEVSCQLLLPEYRRGCVCLDVCMYTVDRIGVYFYGLALENNNIDAIGRRRRRLHHRFWVPARRQRGHCGMETVCEREREGCCGTSKFFTAGTWSRSVDFRDWMALTNCMLLLLQEWMSSFHLFGHKFAFDTCKSCSPTLLLLLLLLPNGTWNTRTMNDSTLEERYTQATTRSFPGNFRPRARSTRTNGTTTLNYQI